MICPKNFQDNSVSLTSEPKNSRLYLDVDKELDVDAMGYLVLTGPCALGFRVVSIDEDVVELSVKIHDAPVRENRNGKAWFTDGRLSD